MSNSASPQWKMLRLGDVASKIQDGTHFSPASSDGPFRYLTSRNVRFGFIDLTASGWVSESEHQAIYRRCDPQQGDLLLTKDGANTGNAAINTLSEQFSLLSSVAMLRFNPTEHVPGFYLQYLLSPGGQSQLKSQMSGNAITRLTLTKIKSLLVPVPLLHEQRRITDILEAADNAILSTERLIAKLERARQGILHDLMTRGIDEGCRFRDADLCPDMFIDTRAGFIPASWNVVRVGEVGDVLLGRQRSPQHQRGRFLIPYLRVANVFDGFIDYSDILSMNFTPREQEIYGLRNNDLLLNEGQSLELVGRCSIYEGRPNLHCFQNTLVRYRCSDSIIPKFAYLTFKYWLALGWFMQVAKKTTSMAHLGASRFAAMPIAVPSLREQQDIVAVFDSFERRITIEHDQLAKQKLMKQGLMNDLLTGRVRGASA